MNPKVSELPRKLKFYLAAPVGNQVIPPLTVEFIEPMPDLKKLGDYRDYHRGAAIRLCAALYDHLPGGTLDHLYAEMSRRQASILSIAHPHHNRKETKSDG